MGGLPRRSLQGRQAAPLQLSTAQLLLPEGGCHSASTPRQGLGARWEPHRALGCSLLPPLEYSTEPPTASRWLCLPPTPHAPPSQQPKDSPGSRGDSALARWDFLPSGVLLMSAKLRPEEGAPAVRHLPPNICILTLAMMIAGIPTIPVPGVREEDMIQAAQHFMAESQAAPRGGGGGVEGEADRRRRSWAATQRLGSACKRDRPRKRAPHRRLLPLFLAQLEK